MIDDPVQSMDAARVDGLARALESVGKRRQIVVFTHDERLPDAFRRLDIAARVLEVARSAFSEVTVRSKSNPVDDYIGDARAVLATQDLPLEVRRRVVPGLCRNAIEAACLDATRHRLLKEGTSFEQIDVRFKEAHRLKERMALAWWGDATKAGEVLGRVKSSFGSFEADCLRAIDSGAHTLIDTDSEALIATAKKLAHAIGSVQ
jgi:hypothetical protein